jgi:hypothetical protein
VTRNIKDWCFKYAGVKYSVFMILVNIFLNCFIVNADYLKILLVTLYYCLSTVFILAMFKAAEEKTNIITALILPILMLLTIKSILFFAVTGILIFYIKSKKWRIIQSIALCLYIFLFGAIGLLVFVFSDMVQITYHEFPAPNNEYKIIVIESDQGALGGGINIVIEKNGAIVNRLLPDARKEIFRGRWKERPNVLWLDNETILMNGQRIKIHEN